MTYTETALVDTIEQLSGMDLAALTQAQRQQFDQFHSGGAEAVERLLPSLDLALGMRVLDVGAGFGGPARQIAISSGCEVMGVDITPAYVEMAQALTRAAGLEGRVSFVCSDVANVHDEFDAGYTMHVQMNVEDKVAFFTDIARCLRPGARFAVFEVCAAGAGRPTTPLPWSLDGTDSYLATPGELVDTITAAGFETVEWVDETGWVQKWFAGVADRVASAANSAVLPALLHDGPARTMNFAVAVNTGVVSIYRGAFVRTGSSL